MIEDKKTNSNWIKKESEIYNAWEKSKAFTADYNSKSEAYTIMIPPPNVTGSLHIGHALTMTLQDILIRFKRMQNYDTLWQPGTDHAGIATQMMVEKDLATKSIKRLDLGRSEFTKEVWKWKNHSGGNITKQLKRLGASLDWSRERFTLDEGFSASVQKAFIDLYKDGLIYRAKRLVNWDSNLQSAVSDLEVKNKETKGYLWYIKYPLYENKDCFITIATTRPETMLGDTAIAVHPDDKRYIDLIGKNAISPLTGIIIPIIADNYCDSEKGTGAVKITPAHDFNDFEVGRRHNLKMPIILDNKACIVIDEIKDHFNYIENVSDLEFCEILNGRKSSEARELIIDKLKKLNLIDKIESHISHVPYAERGNTIIEPRLTTQWFFNVDDLAESATKLVEKEEIKFVPKQWENTFFSWMSNIQPWCISRQLWWGHRIPAWYGPDGKIFVCDSKEEAIKEAEIFYRTKDIILSQDEDVLDTWFSAALWPFATLGWPNNTPEFEKYYPTNILVTGFDIIFFWVARMIMMGKYFTNKIPFHTVFIHGLVLDESGQKMSKTKGNVIDPLEIMDQYGADALRWTVCTIAGPSRDLKLTSKQIEVSRNFITKITNAAVFLERNNVKHDQNFLIEEVEDMLCRWIISKTNNAIREASDALESFRFDLYTEILYNFVWHIFCDWFIELSKSSISLDIESEICKTAAKIFGIILNLLHPVIPFATEELWSRLNYGSLGTLIKNEWPSPIVTSKSLSETDKIDWIINLVTSIRSARAEMNIPHKAKIKILIENTDNRIFEYVEIYSKSIKNLTGALEINILNIKPPKESIRILIDKIAAFLILDNEIDQELEKTRLRKEISKIEAKINNFNIQINNKDFISNAPSNIVENRKNQMKLLQDDLEKLNIILDKIS